MLVAAAATPAPTGSEPEYSRCSQYLRPLGDLLETSARLAVADQLVMLWPQGDPPDNMRKFWKLLLRKNLPPNVLSGVSYAVFGLGDSGYVKYNVSQHDNQAAS